MIKLYDTYNTKGFQDELIFGNFNDQPIPSDYYNLLNNDNNYGNNIPVTPVDDTLPDNEGVKYSDVQNDEDINDEIIFDDDESHASYIDPLQKKNILEN